MSRVPGRPNYTLEALFANDYVIILSAAKVLQILPFSLKIQLYSTKILRIQLGSIIWKRGELFLQHDVRTGLQGSASGRLLLRMPGKESLKTLPI